MFQVSDGEVAKWNLALNNVRNVQTELPDDAPEIEVVAYGPGIGMLKGDSPIAARVADTLKNGVKVVACENTMKGMDQKKGDKKKPEKTMKEKKAEKTAKKAAKGR